MTLTATEQKTLDDIAAAQARGEDPFGDNDDLSTSTNTVADDANTDATAKADDAADKVVADSEGAADSANTEDNGKSEESLDESVLEAIANDDQPMGSDPLQFNVQVPTDYKTTRAALLAEKAEAMGKLMEGELDSKEYAAIEARVMESLEDLSAQRIRAETLLEANAQTAANAQQAAISALIVRAKNEVPYATETKAQKQFDMALKLQLEDPDNAGMPFAHAVNEAHKVVMAMRGVQLKAPPAQASKEEIEAAAQARRPKGDLPITLRNVPVAATANTGGTIADQLSRLSGIQYEAAFSKLTPAQRASMLDE